MIQIILARHFSSRSGIRSRFLLDPEVLSDLQHEAQLERTLTAELADQFSLTLHDLRMGGAWKRTNRGRLKRTEEMLCAHIPPQLHSDFVLLDVGASDGVTTVEAAQALRSQLGPRIRCYVADLNLWLYRYRWGPIVEYRAHNGEPIMARVGCFGLRLAKQRRGSDTQDGSFLAEQYLKNRSIRASMVFEKRISLINPLAVSDPNVDFFEFDCLTLDSSLVGTISAVRASNVLNLGYFTPKEIQRAIANFHAYLLDGGCLIVSRNCGEGKREKENGSVWTKVANRFRLLEHFGSGSEISCYVDGWTARAEA